MRVSPPSPSTAPRSTTPFAHRRCEELIDAFLRAGWDRTVGVIVLTGAGRSARSAPAAISPPTPGHYDGRGVIGLPLEELQAVIRDVPKPVIAKVRGYAIGGGHVLALLCDLTLAAESARFGQVGPKVGSVDPGFGTAYMARVIGEKRAREIWYLCRQYTAAEAVQMGLRQQGGAGRRTRCRGRPLVRGDPGEKPDRAGARQALVQRRHRAYRRHIRARPAGGRSLLRHRRIQGRRARLSGKAQAEVPEHQRKLPPASRNTADRAGPEVTPAREACLRAQGDASSLQPATGGSIQTLVQRRTPARAGSRAAQASRRLLPPPKARGCVRAR